MKVTVLVILLLAITLNAAQYAVQVDFLRAGITDSSGNPLSSGLVYTYNTSGVLTAFYTDRAKTTTLTNPIVLDARGVSEAFADGLYNIVIKNSTGSTQYTWNNMKYEGVANPWYDVAAYASLNAAVTAIGATSTDLLINSATTMTGNVAVPITTRLIITPAGSINQGAFTLTINGDMQTTDKQIFTGTGTVAFGSGFTKELKPQWWGAKGDNATSCTAALRACITAASASGKAIKIPAGTYQTNTLEVTGTSIKISGDGPYNTILLHVGTGGTMLQVGSGTGGATFANISDLTLSGSAVANYGIRCYGAAASLVQNLVVRNVRIFNCATIGLYVDENTIACSFENVKIQTNPIGIQVDSPSCNLNRFVNCDISSSSSYCIYMTGTSEIYSNRFESCNIDSGTLSGLYIDTGYVLLTQFSQCWFENNGRCNVILQGGSPIKFESCNFNSSATDTVSVEITGNHQLTFDSNIFTGQLALGGKTIYSVSGSAPVLTAINDRHVETIGGASPGSNAYYFASTNETSFIINPATDSIVNYFPIVTVLDSPNPFTNLRNQEAASAPGANYGSIRWLMGTNPGTLKLVGYAGTSAVAVTIVDNVGAGCTP